MAIGENSLELAPLQFNLVKIFGLTGRGGNQGFAQHELKARDQDADHQDRNHHLDPADAELLAREHFAGAVEQSEAEQHSGEAGDRQ